MSSTPKIIKVTPIDFYELVIEFEGGRYRSFMPGKMDLYKAFPFLAYPNQLKAFHYDAEKITWFNGATLDGDFLFKHSVEASEKELATKYLRIGFKNQAPTEQDQTHHEYQFSIRPFNLEKPFNLSESIGGGHFDSGGSKDYSLAELLDEKAFEAHLNLANCAWAIDLIKRRGSILETHGKGKLDVQKIIDTLVLKVCELSKPTT